MNRTLEIVADEIAAACANAESAMSPRYALQQLVEELINQLPMDVKSFDAEAFKARCACHFA